MKKTYKFFLLIVIVPLLTGCWDRIEIEERGFVVGVGIDLAEKDKEKDSQVFKTTCQFVVPVGIGGPTIGAGNKKAFMNVSETGDNMFEITRKMATKVARSPFYEHLQVLILSEDVVRNKENLPAVLDFFLRDHEMRRAQKLLIARDSAKDILDFEPKVEKLPSMYIDSISENYYKTAVIMKPARIGDVHEYLLQDNNFVIPSIRKSEDGVKIDGAAVFRGNNNKLIGFIDEQDVASLNFITGDAKGAEIKTQYKDNVVMFEVQNAKSKIEPKIHSEDDIEFNIKISTEGNIVLSHTPVDFLDDKEVDKIEKAIEKALEEEISKTIKDIQKDLKVDILGLNRILEQKEYETWKKIKNKWDQGEGRFPASKINVKVDTKVRTSGSTGQSLK